MSFFDPALPAAGSSSVRIELEGLTVAIEGLDTDLAARLLERYLPYAVAVAPSEPATLRVRFSRDVTTEHYIDPPRIPETNPVLIACDGDRVRYLGYRVAGWFDTRGGRGEIRLAEGDYEPDLRAIENYVRAAVAWQAAGLGGALVHSASAVWKGRGYLFYGPSGAGKSTLSACNTRAQILSDDLSLVLPSAAPGEGGSGLRVVGSPFRGTYTGGPPVKGAFPLVTGFRIVKAAAARVESVPRVQVLAELIANLTFLIDAFPARPDLFQTFEQTFARLPLYHLHFRKDDSYWDAIESGGL